MLEKMAVDEAWATQRWGSDTGYRFDVLVAAMVPLPLTAWLLRPTCALARNTAPRSPQPPARRSPEVRRRWPGPSAATPCSPASPEPPEPPAAEAAAGARRAARRGQGARKRPERRLRRQEHGLRGVGGARGAGGGAGAAGPLMASPPRSASRLQLARASAQQDPARGLSPSLVRA